MKQDIPAMNITKIGTGDVQIIWAHGWGQDNRAFETLAQSFASIATSYLPDFHGHGKTPEPPHSWTTRDYANAVTAWLKTLPATQKRIWIGHSFGCRVGLQLAAHHPETINAAIFIGAAGLKRERPLAQKIWFWLKTRAFKIMKVFVPEGPARDNLRARFGSSDYARASNTMRQILINVINEDLSKEAENTEAPTLIICGANDTETPPEISKRLHAKIKNSQLEILDGFDHYSILTTGKHQVAALIKSFMDKKI